MPPDPTSSGFYIRVTLNGEELPGTSIRIDGADLVRQRIRERLEATAEARDVVTNEVRSIVASMSGTRLTAWSFEDMCARLSGALGIRVYPRVLDGSREAEIEVGADREVADIIYFAVRELLPASLDLSVEHEEPEDEPIHSNRGMLGRTRGSVVADLEMVARNVQERQRGRITDYDSNVTNAGMLRIARDAELTRIALSLYGIQRQAGETDESLRGRALQAHQVAITGQVTTEPPKKPVPSFWDRLKAA